jgi:hypothetical protein
MRYVLTWLTRLDNGPPAVYIFRGKGDKSLQKFLETRDYKYLKTSRPGDFHNHHNLPVAAYFTFDYNYAVQLAGSGGTVIAIELPREVKNTAFVWDAVPNNAWYEVSSCFYINHVQFDVHESYF